MDILCLFPIIAIVFLLKASTCVCVCVCLFLVPGVLGRHRSRSQCKVQAWQCSLIVFVLPAELQLCAVAGCAAANKFVHT